MSSQRAKGWVVGGEWGCARQSEPTAAIAASPSGKSRPGRLAHAAVSDAHAERPVEVIDLTSDDVIIDLTSDCNELPVRSKINIPWMSKLPKLDPSKKIQLARRLSVRDKIDMGELRKDAAWFEETELLFKVAMPQ